MILDHPSFLFLSANTPWVYALAESLAADHPVHAVRLYDWQTYWQQSPSLPSVPQDADLEQTLKVLPPGYAGRLEPLFRPYTRWKLRQWQTSFNGTDRPFVVAPYFYLAPWVTREVPSDRLIYYNLDEYTLYRPERSTWIQRQETQMVEHAAVTICLSKHQVDTLRSRYPDQADRIHHFPLGVDERFIPGEPSPPASPDTVGYVGNLSDRVDWAFVREVAEQCSDLQFVFAGSRTAPEGAGTEPDWVTNRRAAFSLPNVTHLGRIPQDEVTDVYWSVGVNWIPYDPEHPFNVASCPTKVMDSIASGRPVVSTPVPECTLYPEWIAIVETPEEAAQTLRRQVQGHRDEPLRDQVQFARTQTWPHRARELKDLLSSSHADA
jgi:glycosyltransferase involved in cell wall biosynthesis